ncbi:MAG: DNA lesion error-prone repair protein ImuA [Xanthomonadales bacterium]|nr:DNA lesion error-prone repair protein ImuA [Xanthomonadales bacterium]
MVVLPEHPRLWRGGRPTLPARSLPLALAELGGLPAEGLSELLLPAPGQGEWRLLAPALAGCGGTVALVAPPLLPYPPGLAALGLEPRRLLLLRAPGAAERLWALEQILRAGCCPLALGWIGEADFAALRRLRLAAAEGGSAAVLLRPEAAARLPSPAALRLRLAAGALEVLKGPGLRPGLRLPCP